MLANSSQVAPLVVILRINDDLLARALDGVHDDQLWHRPTEKNNPILWIVGHIAQTRAVMLGLVRNGLGRSICPRQLRGRSRELPCDRRD